MWYSIIYRGNIIKKTVFAGFILGIFLFASVAPSLSGMSLKQKDVFLVSRYDHPIYSPTPDWVSDNPHYSTGAALADLNHDGWLDLVVADGNDISPGHLNVYYNDGNGAFPTSASWQSDDVGYNGHLDVADVNGDGWLDVAVAYLGEYDSVGPIARVYLNNHGVLSSLPDWNADILGNAFGVAFGDINNDGRPDLAVATGWPYSPQKFYHNCVYLNDNGTLESSASWQSYDTNHYMGALWVDADHDHWLDLAYIALGEETQIYRNLGGMLERNASWQTQDSSSQDGIMLTAGDVNNDGLRDLFATDNTQLGGSGNFKQYLGLSAGFFEVIASWSNYGGYGSAVALADVNGDNLLDLATGAWWDHTRLFFNDGSGLPDTPSWTSGGTSVVEKIVFGDVGPTLYEQQFSEYFLPQGDQRLFYLSRQPIQDIKQVRCDGVILNSSAYTYSREHSWITIGESPYDSVEVTYNYSRSLDMVVSNWDSSIGNYLYYNQLDASDLDCQGNLSWTKVPKGSVVEGTFIVQNSGAPASELNWEIIEYPQWGSNWAFTPSNGEGLTPEDGIVEVEVSFDAPIKIRREFTGQITIMNNGNPYDSCTIEIYLKTAFNKNYQIRAQPFALLQRIMQRASNIRMTI